MKTRDPSPFVVAGCGQFPADMLRYDECWPADALSADAIALNTQDMRARESRRTVKVITHRRGPTIARWRSFGWRVISHDDIGRLDHADIEAAIAAETRPS